MDIKKVIHSTLIAEFGFFNDIPEEYEVEDIRIGFAKVEGKENIISINFDFGNTDFSREEAEIWAREETYIICNIIALESSLHLDSHPCCGTEWGSKVATEIGISVSGRARIVKSVTTKFKNRNYKKFSIPLEFYNRSLFYLHQPGKERECAVWLYHAWEALAAELQPNIKDNRIKKFKKKLRTTYGFTDETVEKLNKSIGRYYRHYSRPDENSINDPFSIQECVKLMSEILSAIIN